MFAAMRRLGVLLGFMLLGATCCNGGKLWGVDVGKTEEKSEFESLLAQASGKTSASNTDVESALAMLKDIDMSALSLSQLGTYLVDVAIEVVENPEWQQQMSEPGVVRELLDSAGMDSLVEDDSLIGPGKNDLVALLALEEHPVLYKTKAKELVDMSVEKLRMLRTEVADPEKLKKVITDALKSAGLDRESINQVMELVDNPQMLAEQVETLLENPALMAEITKAMTSFTQASEMVESANIDEDELVKMLTALDENPELADEIYAELMKDPSVAEILKVSGLTDMGGGIPAGDGDRRGDDRRGVFGQGHSGEL